MSSWINYRNEMDVLINGRGSDISQGHWIIFRLSHIGEYSQYWDPTIQSAVGGPKYNFTDIPVKCIDKPGSSMGDIKSSESLFNAGLDDLQVRVFAIENKSFINNVFIPERYVRYPNKEDIIYEIDKFDSIDTPRPPIKILDRYAIVHCELVKGDNGQVEIIYVFGKRVHGVN